MLMHVNKGNKAGDDAVASSPVPLLPAHWQRRRQQQRKLL
jgi:hypothetical protein